MFYHELLVERHTHQSLHNDIRSVPAAIRISHAPPAVPGTRAHSLAIFFTAT